MSFLRQVLLRPDVAKAKRQNDIDRLVDALCYWWDAKLRQEAAVALSGTRDPKAFSALIDAAWDDDVSVRKAALAALVECVGTSDEIAGELEGWLDTRSKVPEGTVERFRSKLERLFRTSSLEAAGDVTGLIDQLLHSSGVFSKPVIEALGRIDAPEARSTVEICELIDKLRPPACDQAALRSWNWRHPASVRRGAAEELAALYRGGQLSSLQERLILGQRSWIAKPHVDRRHTDRRNHTDWDKPACAGGGHNDRTATSHTDRGIGIEL